MNAEDFMLAAAYGDEAEAREALVVDSSLARVRNEAGVSVVAATVYAGRLPFAREIANTRDDLDLFEAACIGETERVLAILDENPDMIDDAAPDGFAAVGFAAFFGHSELLEALIERGAALEIPARNAMQVRPIHSAVAHADQELALTLTRARLAAAADPNARQQGGETPLHEAVYNENEPLIELLLANGADAHLRNEDGQSPLEQARAEGKDRIAARLTATVLD